MFMIFILDTNSSMNVRVSGGFTLLDLSKSAVEHFLKNRAALRNVSDRYLLLTTDENQDAARISLAGETAAVFGEQVKKLTTQPPAMLEEATVDTSNFHPVSSSAFPESSPVAEKASTISSGKDFAWGISNAISLAFSLLNQSRMQTGIDTYGWGRNPWMLEPAAVILLTDAYALRPSLTGEVPTISLTFGEGFGAELSAEPFRWDQRLFSLVVGPQPEAAQGSAEVLPAMSTVAIPESLKAMCEVTGGWYSCAYNLQGLISRIDSLLHKIAQVGPVVQLASTTSFEQSPTNQPPSVTRALLTMRNPTGLWPIPESYWSEKALEKFPARTAQPLLLYQRSDPGSTDAVVTTIDIVERLNLPVDYYELEWCGQPLNMGRAARWPVYLPNSGRARGKGEPFGFLRASPNAGRVIFANLPYNYPKLLPLLKQATELLQVRQGMLSALSPSWKQEFNLWLSGVPPYYNTLLRKALKRYGVTSLIPERPEGGLSKKLIQRMVQLRDHCKSENEKIEQANKKDVIDATGREKKEKMTLQNLYKIPVGSLLEHWEQIRSKMFGGCGMTVAGLYNHGIPGEKFSRKNVPRLPPDLMNAREEDFENHTVRVNQQSGNCFGPGLLAEVATSLAPTKPIVEMSNYVDVLLGREVLRDPLHPEDDEDTPQGEMRRKLSINFGNPFRLKPSKPGQRLMVDEAAAEAELLMTDTARPPDEPDQDMEEVSNNGAAMNQPQEGNSLSGDSSLLNANKTQIKDGEGKLGEKRSYLQLPRLEKRQRQKPPTKKPHILATSPPQGSAQNMPAVTPPGSVVGVAPVFYTSEIPVATPVMTTLPETPQTGVYQPITPPTSPIITPLQSPVGVETNSLAGENSVPSASAVTPPLQLSKASQPQERALALDSISLADSKGTRNQLAQQQQVQTHPINANANSVVRSVTEPQSPGQMPVLPEGWMVCFSKREKRHYYFNTRTNESRWVPP